MAEAEELADSFCGKTLLYWCATPVAAMFSFSDGKTIYLKVVDGRIEVEYEQAH